MGESLEIRRRRLRYRSWHRGTKEADLLLGGFADRHLGGMDAAALDLFEALLGEPDPSLMTWMTGRAPPPDRLDHAVMRDLLAFTLGPRR